MSDTNWTQPEPGDPGTPRDVNREGDVVWDGTDPEKYAGQTAENAEAEKPAKKATARKATSEKAEKADS